MTVTPLGQLDVLLLDAQTTGANPAHGALLELAWCRTRADSKLTGVHTRVLRLPDDHALPARISQLTGITAEHFVDATAPERAWLELLADSDQLQPQLTVIHFARFEEPFLRHLHEAVRPGSPFPLHLLCTHEIARRLFPSLPRRSLRAMAGYFGHRTAPLKRAHEHVLATAVIWNELVRELAARSSVSTLAQLTAMLCEPAPPRASRRDYPLPREARLALPDSPGVYRMLGAGDEVLYVGKATSLRKRVNSYFTKHRGHADHTLELLTRVTRIEFDETGSALEAALAESEEIKRHATPYNIALRVRDPRVWFATRDFGDLVEAPDEHHTIGPLPTTDAVRSLGLLVATTNASTTPDVIAGILAVPLDHIPDEAKFRAGLELFGLQHGDPSAPYPLIRLGHLLWRERLRNAPELDVETSDPERPTTDEPSELTAVDAGRESASDRHQWEPETVVARIEHRVLRAAHDLRRARWLCHLTDATLTWERSDGVARTLQFRAGSLVFNRGQSSPEPRPLIERQRTFDRALWERLRVLTTELRRLVFDGRHVELRLSARTTLDRRGLGRLLPWI